VKGTVHATDYDLGRRPQDRSHIASRTMLDVFAGRTAGRKAALEFDVAELVDGAGLPQHPALVGVGEEGHQPPWQATAERQPAPRNAKPAPRSLVEPIPEPEREPEPEHDHEPDHEPDSEEGAAIACEHGPGVGCDRQICRRDHEPDQEPAPRARTRVRPRARLGPVWNVGGWVGTWFGQLAERTEN